MKERMDKKRPCCNLASLQQGRIGIRGTTLYLSLMKQEVMKRSPTKKRPYFLSEIGATCAVPPYIILCAYIRNVDRRLHLLISTKELTGDIKSWNAPVCTIHRLSEAWTTIYFVPFIAFHMPVTPAASKANLFTFENSRVSSHCDVCTGFHHPPVLWSILSECLSRSLPFVLSLLLILYPCQMKCQ